MPRKVEIAIETPATPDRVWKAITEPEEIAGWFAPEVSVEPGPNGSMTLGWDPEMKFTTPIHAWEPGVHLQTGEEREKNGETFPIRIDYFIETGKGTTTLRLVHSGFGDTADWDNEIKGYEDGWGMFMAILSHRLKYPDRPVKPATVFRMIQVPRAESWPRLIDPKDGVIQLGDNGRFSVNGADGVVEFLKPNFFRGVIPTWDDSLLSIFCEGGKSSMITITLMLLGDSVGQAAARRSEWAAAVDRVFPPAPPAD